MKTTFRLFISVLLLAMLPVEQASAQIIKPIQNRRKPPTTTTTTTTKPKPPKKRPTTTKPTTTSTPRVDTSVRANETITVNGISFKMIGVQGGTFTMGATSKLGDSDEKPAHQVTLSSFSIGETEVTQELWQAVMGSNPSSFKGSRRPVEQVSWEDCQDFIRRLNNLTGRQFRLPTEAEWEYAARGGNKSKGYKYAGGSNIGDVAWYYGNSSNQTHDVGTKRANELGLYDMAGNVQEWCQDWFGFFYSSSSQTNPTGPASGFNRIIRGGNWVDGAEDCRVSYRRLNSNCTPTYRDGNLGLRLAF